MDWNIKDTIIIALGSTIETENKRLKQLKRQLSNGLEVGFNKEILIEEIQEQEGYIKSLEIAYNYMTKEV